MIVVEPALARLVVTLPSRTVGRTALVATRRTGDLGAAVKTGARRRRTAGEIGAPVAHRAAIARSAARAGGRATITAAATTAVTTTAAAIATATAAAVSTAAAATAIGRTRTARTEAATIAATTAAEATAATTGLAFNGFADRDRATIEQRAIHGLHRGSAHVICFHLEEGEAAAAAGLAIHDHF
ncbi:MAG TPA: hypothetical protein VF949_08745, partial [Reyranella sp.]